MEDPRTAKALLLSANGSDVRIVNFNVKEKDDGDIVDSGMAEFFDPIPELKAWFGDEYQRRAMAIFYVDTAKRDYYDPVARSFIKSDEPAAHGQYCLYYTLSPSLPINEMCMQILGWPPSSHRLFWRGDILVVRYDGHLGLGHRYKDVDAAAIEPVKEVLRRAYESRGLERVHNEDEPFSLQSEMLSKYLGQKCC